MLSLFTPDYYDETTQMSRVIEKQAVGCMVVSAKAAFNIILCVCLFILMPDLHCMIIPTVCMLTIFNKEPISQPWYWYPHVGQQLYKTRYHCPPPK